MFNNPQTKPVSNYKASRPRKFLITNWMGSAWSEYHSLGAQPEGEGELQSVTQIPRKAAQTPRQDTDGSNRIVAICRSTAGPPDRIQTGSVWVDLGPDLANRWETQPRALHVVPMWPTLQIPFATASQEFPVQPFPFSTGRRTHWCQVVRSTCHLCTYASNATPLLSWSIPRACSWPWIHHTPSSIAMRYLVIWLASA